LIVDTNALSAVADGEPKTVERYNNADTIALAVIVLKEFRFGIAHSGKRNDMRAGCESSSPRHELSKSTSGSPIVRAGPFGTEQNWPTHSDQ